MQHISMRIFNDVSQLLYPIRCLSCNCLGTSICTNCRSEWIPHYYKTRIEDLGVHSAIIYSPTASKVILAAKEKGLRSADELLISAIIHVLERAQVHESHFKLVPVPSSKASQRRRGRSFIVDLTSKISAHTGIAVNDCLVVSRKVADQSGLKKAQRLSNMHGAFSLKPGAVLRGDLILIDDVVTTGATLKEAARAINSQGFHAHGSVSAVTACVAQPLRYGE